MYKLTPVKYVISMTKAFDEVKMDTPTNNKQRLYELQVGAFSLRENAEKLHML